MPEFWNRSQKSGLPIDLTPLDFGRHSSLSVVPSRLHSFSSLSQESTLFFMEPKPSPGLLPHLPLQKASPAPSCVTWTACENGMFSRGLPSTQAVCSGSSRFSPTVLFWTCHALLAHLGKHSHVAKIPQTADCPWVNTVLAAFSLLPIYCGSSLLLTIILSVSISTKLRSGLRNSSPWSNLHSWRKGPCFSWWLVTKPPSPAGSA